jgi:hypothetical protein
VCTSSLFQTAFSLLEDYTITENAKMPVESLFPRLDIPDIDLWEFLFERKDREFPDDTGSS